MSREEKRNEMGNSSDGRKVCPVCMHHCALLEGQYGRCRARKNENGKIISVNYGKVTSAMLDPIEKKPLARLASGYQNAGNIGVAFTYNEPLVGYEFVRDTACLVKQNGMKTVVVTNGSVELEILEEILPYIDAMNIDLKGFTEDYYRKLGGNLNTVKAFIERAAKDCHVELTTLIVPGENDSKEEMEQEAAWIASLSPEIPLHVSRFFPRYQMTDRQATEVRQVYRMKQIAEKYLKYVYTGNC